MGIAEWFSSFCTNLVIRDAGTISQRYKSITRRLNTDFWTTTSDTAHSLYVGSYGRNTAIASFSDLDIIFQLPTLSAEVVISRFLSLLQRPWHRAPLHREQARTTASETLLRVQVPRPLCP